MGPTKPEAFRRLINFASGQPGSICQKPNRLASVQSVRHARSLAEHIGDLAHIENGLFEDDTLATGMDKSNDRYTLACSWNDYNLYAVNMWEAAGKRVTMQKEFMPGIADEVRRAYIRDAAGNSLLHHDKATGTFEDVTDKSSTRVGGWN